MHFVHKLALRVVYFDQIKIKHIKKKWSMKNFYGK